MRFFLFLFLLVFCYCSHAQKNSGNIYDISGKPYAGTKYNEYNGTPYLFTSWAKANVITASGTVYPDMLVNINVYENMPVFLKGDTIYSFSDKIKEFIITDKTTTLYFSKGSAFNTEGLPDVYMQKLNPIPVFLKQVSKTLIEVPSYDNPNKIYRFQDNVTYYAEAGGHFEKIHLTKSDAKKVFASKWNQVEEYADKSNISFKNENGWLSLFNYFKTL
jgi:hypothetical protein